MSPSFVAGEGGGSNVAYKVNCRRHTGRKNTVEAGQDRLSYLYFRRVPYQLPNTN